MEVDLASNDGSGTTIPIVVANMTAISGRRMAETIARRGGIAVIPQDIPLEIVKDVISWVKSRHTFFDTPITLSPNETVADAVGLLHKRAHGAIVIVEENKPAGIVTEEDCAGVDRFTQLHSVMSKDLMTLPDTADAHAAFDFLHHHRRKLAPVVSANGELVGILTRISALRATLYSPALDAKNNLRIAAAVGINGDVAAKAVFHSSTITSELATYAVKHANVAAALAEFRFKAPSPLGVGALDVFLADPDLGQYRLRLSHHKTPPGDLLALFNATVKCLPLNSARSFTDMPVWQFVKTHHEYMGQLEAEAVADFLITQDVKETSILDACARHILRLLDISRRTQLLQRCGPSFIASWMSNQDENQIKPEPGEATAVLSSLDNRELRDVAASVASFAPDMALHPLWPEFRVALGAGLLEVSLENRWTNWVKDDTVRFLADHIGDNPAAWSLIVSLWPSFDGSVSELLEIAASLS